MPRKLALNPVYKRQDDSIFLQCAVPACNRNTNNSPHKIFVKVPYRPHVRWDWFKRAKIKVYIPFNTDVYFCGDHFEKRIRSEDVAANIVPTKFECQYFMESDDDGPSNDVDIGIQEETVKSSDPEHSCIPEEISQETSFSPKIQPTSANKTLTSNMKRPSILKRLDTDNTDTEITYIGPRNNIFRNKKFQTWEDVEKFFFTYFAILDHDYAVGPLLGYQINARIKIAKRKIAKLWDIMKYNNLSVSWLKKNNIQKQNNAVPVRISETVSASSVETYKCRYCATEYLHRHDLLNHVEERHLDIRQELIFNKKIIEDTDKELIFNKKQNEDTDSAESIETYKCDYCDIEYIHETDLLSHVEQHLAMNQEEGEETLDIKPEIFQCNKCPASFINEEGMSNHLQIMHGDVIDKYIQSIKSSKNIGNKSKDNYHFTYSVYAEKDYENGEQQNSESLDSFSGFNFAELRTEIEIKKEFSDPLEDVELPMEDLNFDDNLRPNLYHQDSDFSGSHSNINIKIHGTTVGPANEYSPNVDQNKINMMPELNAFTKNQDYGLFQVNNPDVIKCKCCKIPFSNQEELLDHIHELINTKSKLCANVKFKKPDSVCDDTDLSVMTKPKSLDATQLVFDKPEGERESPLIIGHSSNTKPKISKPKCTLCSRRIRNLAAAKRRICVICQRSGKNNKNRRENRKARLYVQKITDVKTPFSNQEELLDYTHELKSTNAKLCTNVKPVMQASSVQFNKPESVCDDDTNSSFMTKPKSLDATQLVFDKPEGERESPLIIGHSSNTKPKISKPKCTLCSRRIRNLAAAKRRICVLCQRSGKNYENRRENRKAPLYVQKEQKITDVKTPFANQEELLDHTHELKSTNAKLCTNVKPVMQADSVQFNKPESVCDDDTNSSFMTKPKSLATTQLVFDKPEGERESPLIIGHSSNTKPNISKPKCTLCSRRIKNLAAAKRRICVICQRSGKNNESHWENKKARLYIQKKEKNTDGKTPFSYQEELLGHTHELKSTKAKFCTNVKPVMQADRVQLNKPENVCDDDTNSSFMDKVKSLDNIQLVFDKPEEETDNPSVTEHSSNSNPKKSKPKCIRCSRRLRNAAAGKRRICVKCQKSGKGEKPRCILCSRRIKNQAAATRRICAICQRSNRILCQERKKARANPCRKIIHIEKLLAVKNDTPQNKSESGLTDEQILDNMHKFFMKTQMKISHARTEERKPIPVDNDLLKPLTKEELENLQRSITESQKKHSYIKIDELTTPVDNDLLKPLRIEDEKILVQPRDPTVCKFCLKPLETTEKSGQNNAICDKCQSIETSNEVRRKSYEERRKSYLKRRISYDKVPVDTKCCVQLERIKIHGCHICRSKFNNKLDLREHVTRSHL